MAGNKKVKTSTERARDSRRRKLDREVNKYIQSLPGTSNMTTEEKMLRYQEMKAAEKEKKKEMKAEEKKKKAVERVQRCRLKRKLELASNQRSEETVEPLPVKIQVTETIHADVQFSKRFSENSFGVICSVCDRLWFLNDLRKVPKKSVALVQESFPNDNTNEFKVCQTCYKSLAENKIPRLSKTNGFRYPEYPVHLPPLDIISERLVSPRIPFMTIRRLRLVHGSKAIIGQVINVPVDVNNMVNDLPRQLEDDYSFNVHIKRHQIHKSPYLAGYVKKSTVKAWLKYLLTKPLYRNIKIDESFFVPTDVPILPGDTEAESNEPLIESISEAHEHVHEMLLAKQHTLMWSEEKYLDLAPGMNQRPMSLIYDENAEELSFPSIYLGESRKFSINNVTPYMMASSEVRRADRRGVKPEHILYMAMKIIRLRLTDHLYLTFMNTGDSKNLTRADVENRRLLENCMERNLCFMRTIPNSVQYWMGRKRDLFAMIRQIGKPTLFVTLSASEYRWSDLLGILYKLRHGHEFRGVDPAVELSSDERTTLVNEDPVACCLYFDKLVDTIMFLLKSPRCSPFKEFRVVDSFKRIEFQQRGSPHAHMLLWLENDPKEVVGESMPATINLIDKLCCIDPSQVERVQDQTHKHTFTCYKRNKSEKNKKCRFGAPFWPAKETTVLIPMPKEDGRRQILKNKFADMHHSLEFEDFDNLDSFLAHHNVHSYENYLNVLRAGINRPRIFLKRTIRDKWMNNFNPWTAKILKSNMDIQFILEPYSCATYVAEYVNKTDRGISSLHRDLIKLRDEYPDKDYTELIKQFAIKMLNSVEMSSQEAAWYLLNLHMSESSRHIEYIPTTWPHDRQRVRKTVKQMDEEELAGDSMNVFKEGLIEKYEKRPEHMATVSLARFTAWYYETRTGEYKCRKVAKIIRYRNYEMTDVSDYKREMVLLHVPFRNEQVDLLDKNKFMALYDEKESEILQARKDFESDINIDEILRICRELCVDEDDENTSLEERQDELVKSQAITDDFAQMMRDGNNDDIMMAVAEKMSAVVRKRENLMTAEEYCKVMQITNMEQRDLILEAIHRMYDGGEPLQVFFTGPAGCGKTFTMKLLMESFNRFSQQHNSAYNAFVACASTGMAAAAVNGTTVHSAFRIGNSSRLTGLSVEALNSFRVAFNNVRIILVDECSMIGSGLLQQIDLRLKHILQNHDYPFGGMNMVFCGDLRQLPPVCQTPIYKRSRNNFCSEIVWQDLQYYPLVQVMRQSDVTFSSILTKIGNGESLTSEEKATIESRFVSKDYVDQHFPEAIRLFFRTLDVNAYNTLSIRGEEVIEYVAQDIYSGYRNAEQLASARSKVHKMKPDETGGLPYMLKLLVGKPYMIRTNIDVIDSLVNGAIGTLQYIERDEDNVIKRLWLSFGSAKLGRLIRTKCNPHVRSNPELKHDWVPIGKRTSNIQLSSKIINCKRTQFPLVEACAITIHKSQGGTYDTVVYNYDKNHEQQLVYVALSRATSLEGMYLTNISGDHTFYHARGKVNQELRSEFLRLERHKFDTIGNRSRKFLAHTDNNPTALSLCTLNTQSLKAHHYDISTDFVLPKVKIMALTETWVENNERVAIPGFQPIAQFKRSTVRAGGVCIYEKEECSTALQSRVDELLKFDQQERKIQRMTTAHDGIGDICAIQTIIDGNNVLLVSVYITPNASLHQLKQFFILNLMAYSHKLDGLFEELDELQLSAKPIILCGDLNIDLKTDVGTRFIEFMKDTFRLDLNNDIAIPTTRNNTCIDGVFIRNVENVQTLDYITYFSHHRPLLSVTNK